MECLGLAALVAKILYNCLHTISFDSWMAARTRRDFLYIFFWDEIVNMMNTLYTFMPDIFCNEIYSAEMTLILLEHIANLLFSSHDSFVDRSSI